MDKTLKKVVFGSVVLGILIVITAFALGAFDGFFMRSPLLQWIKRGLDILIRINVIWVGLVILLEKKDPSKTIAWLMVLVLLPLVGFLFYMLFGKSIRKRHKAEAKSKSDSDRMERAAEIQSSLMPYMVLPNSENINNKRLMQLLLNNAKAPFSLENEVQVLTNGKNKFNCLIEQIKSAKHHIHLEYFIIKDDAIGNEIANLLVEKAKSGVAVRVIFDDVGSWALGKAYIGRLKAAGVEIYPFFEVVLPVLSRELNYRNHRKIAIIDGEIAMIGGLNIGDEYIGGGPKFKFWRDTHLAIKGEAVYALQSIFLNDWYFVSGEWIDDKVYFPKVSVEAQSLIQIAASGPDSEWKCILQAFYKMIAIAEERLFIASPYLVPEESLLMGLKTAALSGIDVRIIIPSKADHFFVYWASQSYIEMLLEAGVKIYAYQKGFIHSKIVIVDDKCASVGTANFDIRSMELNFEVNAFMYDKKVIERLEEDFFNDIEDSQQIQLEAFKKRKWWRKGLEAVGRLVSPLQ